MPKQIAVRLPDDTVDFLDRLVADGVVESRAAAVKIALDRDRRRRQADADIEILLADPDDELQALAEFNARQSFEHLD